MIDGSVEMLAVAVVEGLDCFDQGVELGSLIDLLEGAKGQFFEIESLQEYIDREFDFEDSAGEFAVSFRWQMG